MPPSTLPTLFHLVLLLLAILPPISAQLTPTGSTLVLNGISYYVPAIPFFNVEHDFKSSLLNGKASAAGLIPATVVSGVRANFSQSDLEKTVGLFDGDDVWSGGFLEGTCWGWGGFDCGVGGGRSVGACGDGSWFLTHVN